MPATLVAKLQILGLHRSLCSWILDFLTGRSQVVKMGNNTSSPLVLNTGAPQCCVLSPLLYSLYTHDCTATPSSNVIIKFADDTTVTSLITDNNETAYREEVSSLTKWCQKNDSRIQGFCIVIPYTGHTKERNLVLRSRSKHKIKHN